MGFGIRGFGLIQAHSREAPVNPVLQVRPFGLPCLFGAGTAALCRDYMMNLGLCY